MRRHTQKLWRMKGCSKKKSNTKSKVKTTYKKKHGLTRKRMVKKQKGGCTSCLQKGGSNGSNGALVGSPWSGSVSDWPGVAGKDGQTNYFSLNTYPVDPQTQTISERSDLYYMKGGKRMKHRGGGIIPDDLVNLGRSIVNGVGTTYNALNGYAPPVNPLPYKDQLVKY
jgi:hypothetical protein